MVNKSKCPHKSPAWPDSRSYIHKYICIYFFLHILRAQQESLNKHIYFNTLIVLLKFNKDVLLGWNNVMPEYLFHSPQNLQNVYILEN